MTASSDALKLAYYKLKVGESFFKTTQSFLSIKINSVEEETKIHFPLIYCSSEA